MQFIKCFSKLIAFINTENLPSFFGKSLKFLSCLFSMGFIWIIHFHMFVKKINFQSIVVNLTYFYTYFPIGQYYNFLLQTVLPANMPHQRTHTHRHSHVRVSTYPQTPPHIHALRSDVFIWRNNALL